MIDSYGRTIRYLRVSVTDRCNFRCRYCMPTEGIRLLRHRDIVSFEEIVAMVRSAVGLGITKVRLTGGEPLVRRDILRLVRVLSEVAEIDDLAMTTNGALLAEFAHPLAQAGLDRVNVSLDTTDPEHFRSLTRGGDIAPVLLGIDAALAAGLTPVKLNCVQGEFTNEADVQSVRDFGRRKGLEVRTIHQMKFETGYFSVVEGGSGGDCSRCNRLRLSSDGRIRPCLFSDLSFSIREFGPSEALRRAVAAKPETGGQCAHNGMRRIGG